MSTTSASVDSETMCLSELISSPDLTNGCRTGNEMARPKVAAGYPSLRKLLDSLFPDGKTAPKLAGPDLYAQHSYQYTLDQALAGEDKDVRSPQL